MIFDFMDDKIYNEATDVTARDGAVVLDGPDGVDVSVTPEAAEETSNRLFDAAAEARGQEIMRKHAQPKKIPPDRP
ncbi:MAG TPA: hypothetical protein VGB08_10445 [Allosphingosinicella sp.]